MNSENTTSPAPVHRLVGRISKSDAQRSKHLANCAGYEDCQCFGKYWSHKDIYLMQEDIRLARIILLDAMRVLARDKSAEADALFHKINVYLYPPNSNEPGQKGSVYA